VASEKVGPFIDALHDHIKLGNVDCSLTDLFKEKFSSRIQKLTEIAGTQTILVPSLQDAHHPEFMFPQAAFQRRELGLPEVYRSHCCLSVFLVTFFFFIFFLMQTGVLCYPNPVNLYINEVAIGISSVDVIFHLSSEEASRGLTDNRINRLAGYLLDQRSFYPLFPPRPGTQLELPRLKQLDIPVTPDLMLLPSNLAPFAKEVDGVLCVNPGKLTKAQQGGTYTKLSIFPIKKSGKTRALHFTF